MNFKKALQVIKEVFSEMRYLLMTGMIFLILGLLLSLIQNFPTVLSIFSYNISILQKLSLLFSVIINLYSNLSGVSLAFTLCSLLLLSSNITLAFYYFKKRSTYTGAAGVGIAGVLAVLGTSCAACGGVLITSIASFFGASSLLAFFPLDGLEFSLLAVCILLYSIYRTSLAISQPLVC